jgi:hypothetical protein
VESRKKLNQKQNILAEKQEPNKVEPKSRSKLKAEDKAKGESQVKMHE